MLHSISEKKRGGQIKTWLVKFMKIFEDNKEVRKKGDKFYNIKEEVKQGNKVSIPSLSSQISILGKR